MLEPLVVNSDKIKFTQLKPCDNVSHGSIMVICNFQCNKANLDFKRTMRPTDKALLCESFFMEKLIHSHMGIKSNSSKEFNQILSCVIKLSTV